MDFQDILYGVDASVATITLNRPRYRNAQSYRTLDEIDAAFTKARDDRNVRVLVIRGSGGNFSSGHDLGTPDSLEYRRQLGAAPGIETYDQFKKYNLDLLVGWRNFPKPTIAMVEGYCIYAGWMLAACCDVVFASHNAEFLAGFVEYMSIPWDIGIKKAKEICFESRFISAEEAREFGFVNRVCKPEQLERETYAYAHRVAEQSPDILRFIKLQSNTAQAAHRFQNALDEFFGDVACVFDRRGEAQRLEDRELSTPAARGEQRPTGVPRDGTRGGARACVRAAAHRKRARSRAARRRRHRALRRSSAGRLIRALARASLLIEFLARLKAGKQIRFW